MPFRPGTIAAFVRASYLAKINGVGVSAVLNGAVGDQYKNDRLAFELSASEPALKRSGTTLAVRLANVTADAPLTAGTITASGPFYPSVTNTHDIGHSGAKWNHMYLGGTIQLGASWSAGLVSG